jgi:RND superfamily putative drug exporter
MPFIFAACTVMATLTGVYVYAHFLTTATYVTNLVFLIGLGIAIDYSLLVVYRFREELRRGGDVEPAIVRTMQTAGRAVVFSGATVAIGLALLLFIPLPFVRSIGVGGFLIPVASIAAALTLQPALLSLYGRGGVARIPLLPRRFRAEEDTGFWHRLAGAIMRRPLAFLAGGAVLLVAAAIPVFALQLTPGSASGIPQFPQSVRGFDVLKDSIGPGAISPTQVVVDSGRPGGVRDPRVQAAITRLAATIRADRETALVRVAPRQPFVDPSGRYEELIVAGRDEYGSEAAQSFVHRLRGKLVPAAGFPGGTRVLAGGGPPQGVDFLDQAYRYFPWLVAVVLVLTYFLLMRAFRSALLPLKAVILNLLSVGAAYGILVWIFQDGHLESLLGFESVGSIVSWMPIFLFVVLFGLSMDYHVFILTRIREAYDRGMPSDEAVAHGIKTTAGVVTSAAVVMISVFAIFATLSLLIFKQLGVGLAVAVLIDATIIRGVLLPATMKLLGDWNWYLPSWLEWLPRVTHEPELEPLQPDAAEPPERRLPGTTPTGAN